MNKKIVLLLTFALLALCMLLSACSNGVDKEADHEHEYFERVYDPSCTEDGRKEKICSICFEIKPLSVIPATGHDPHDWQTKREASCTEGKLEEKVCKNCGEVVDTRVSKALGHKAGEWQVKVDASCTENKIEHKICTVCGDFVEGKVGEKIAHEYVQAVVSGTCAVGEHVLYTCRFCGDSYRDNYSEKREPHVEGGWIIEKAPTCVSSGSRVKICSVCGTGLEYDSNVAPDKNNHSFKVETVAPTDTDPGYTLYTCQLCGYTIKNEYESSYIPARIYEMIVSSTVRIESYSKKGELMAVGSGFFISEQGQIATNYHVIAGAHSLKVKNYSGVEYEVIAVNGYDASNDIAVIKINETGTTHLNLSAIAPKTGDTVYALGSPLGIDDIFTDGVVSNPNKMVNGVHYIVFSAPVSPGNSGGPLVNGRGEVIGINTQTAVDGQNINFAIFASQITNLDKSHNKTVEEVYTEAMNISGLNILAAYIMQNSERTIGEDVYVITREIMAEISGGYGRNYQLIYDSENSTVTVSINWTTGKRNIYSFEFVISRISSSYVVKMYDHVWSQYTMEGTFDATAEVTSTKGEIDMAVFNKVFKLDYINYSVEKGDPLTEASAKRLMNMAYVHMLESFEAFLSETDTGLTLETFNLNPLVKADEQEQSN